jgi:transmembrane sensor
MASVWLARRDRGLSPEEQDAYLDWLYQDPLHGRAILQLERVWASLNLLAEWRPTHSALPNPDLLAPRRPSRLYWISTALAAAAVTFAFHLWLPRRPEIAAPHRGAIIHPGPERRLLEDGSIVELNTGARIEVRFTPEERGVRLVGGEAHFTVAKNPARPFVVSADKISVRAVGTAFSVALNREAVSVLVTEGKVRLDETPAAPAGEPVAARELSSLSAGQQAVISTQANRPAVPEVREVSPSEIERALSWQGLRLEFVDMPLADVVAEFNRYNLRKLVVEDPQTRGILIGGNFRADNVETFVRLLDSVFGVTAVPRGNEIVLRRAP